MRKLTFPKLSKSALIGISAVALTAVAGTAYAAQRGEPMTRTEVQARSAEHFAKMDSNKDGKLDATDRAAHQTAMFDRLDGNKDGSVTREEFAAARPGPGGDRAAGERMGRREGGAGEGRHRGGRGGHMGGGAHLLGMADTNKDGAVTQAEFTAASLAMFDKADANKDGTVTREERRAAHAAMRAAAPTS
jgi:Ca2+-binding EF-hand superfamily protein